MTGTWIVRMSRVVRFLKIRPKCLVNEDIVDSVGSTNISRIPLSVFNVQDTVEFVNRGSMESERDEVEGKRIELGLTCVTDLGLL